MTTASADTPRPGFAALARECVADFCKAWGCDGTSICWHNLTARIAALLSHVVQEREAQLVQEFANAIKEHLTPAQSGMLLAAIRQGGTP
jgi:hypothetical protein